MADVMEADPTRAHGGIGLCSDCRHVRRLTSARGKPFYQCGRARSDRAFPPYPPLPVMACPGYERDTEPS